MDASALHELLTAVAAGAVAPEDAARQLSRLPFADLGFALVDHHRALRQGLPEAIYGPGKTPEQCAAIVGELLEHGVGPVLLTRASAEQLAACPPGMTVGHTAVWRPDSPRPEAVALMVRHDVGSLVVIDSDGLTVTVTIPHDALMHPVLVLRARA